MVGLDLKWYLATIPADMSPVNTFRVLFACLDDKQPRLLPAKHYLMYYLGWQPSGEVRNATKIIRNRVKRANSEKETGIEE